MKDGFLGWLQNAFNPRPQENTDKPEARTGPLKPPVKTGALAGDNFVRSTSPLRQAATPPSTTPLKNKTPEEEAADSKKRMAFIVAYLKDPTAEQAFQDKALVYRILAEERSYQQMLVAKYTQDLKLAPILEGIPEEDPRYEAIHEQRRGLEEKLNSALGRQAQIYSVQKKLMGVKKKTGGTEFLGFPPGV